jgi:hypothetical protein
VNLLKNDISVDQAKDLVSILKEHPTLKSLCGNKGDETKLDMSGKMSGAGDAIMFAAEIVDNEALSKLIFGGDGDYYDSKKHERVKYESAALTCGMREANFRDKNLGGGGAIIISAWLSHRDKGAILSLDMSGNHLNEGSSRGMDSLGPAVGASNITSLNIANNYLYKNGGMEAVTSLLDKGAMTSLNLSNNTLVSYLGDGKYDHSGEFHISCFRTQHQLVLNPLFSQALSPLPMSSPI